MADLDGEFVSFAGFDDRAAAVSRPAANAARLAEEESMAKMDDDFVRALRHGMAGAPGLATKTRNHEEETGWTF